MDVPEILEGTEVMTIKDTDQILMPHTTFKVSEIFTKLQQHTPGNTVPKRKWFVEGAECEILNPYKGWRKGKVKICLLFYPDEPAVEEPPASNKPESTEPESPLDDIRRMINEENQ